MLDESRLGLFDTEGTEGMSGGGGAASDTDVSAGTAVDVAVEAVSALCGGTLN